MKGLKQNKATVFVVRHGETQWNVARLLQGQKDSSLTDKGIAQAKELAKKFAEFKIDKVVASDLIRARRTAEFIAAEHKLTVATTKLLRERTFGKFEGKKWTDLESELKGQIKEMENLAEKERFGFKLNEEIESDEELVGRFITYLRQMALGWIGQTVVVVTHGGMMRALLVHLGEGSYEEYPSGSIENLGYIKILTDGVEIEVSELLGIRKAKLARRSGRR